jgi:DNA-directed RNA polymerase specialized sigma24 family protein
MDPSLSHLAGGISDGDDTRNAEARSGMSGALPTDGPELSEYRPLLLSIAYRMLGSVAEAEDIVQEASLRFHNVRKEGKPSSNRRRPTWPRLGPG